MRFLLGGVAAVVALVLVLGSASVNSAQDKKEPKFTISEVMKKAHAGKNALRAKVLKGEATDEEKAQLTALYVALSENTPPAGEAEKWKKVTKDILDAYKSGDLKAYEKATNCGACHGEFKKKKAE
jgi:hypothetical protein